jgi:hypothetical protein
MPSTLTWLDHSESDRKRVLEAIDRFKETDTRDELGLGAIRDGFADVFFPGTSTIQTRARYFLFVPWVYASLARKRVDSATIALRARKEETRVRDALVQSDDNEGTIGALVGAALKRLPSNVYWSGLGVWHIRLFPGSQDDFHRYFDRLDESEGARDDDGDLVNGARRRPWHAHLPNPPADFPVSASFRLTYEEAHYLAERICFSAPRSLLAFLVQRARTLDAPYPWAHPQLGEFPQAVQHALGQARLLAEGMHGAALLYNLMLAEEFPVADSRDRLVEGYRLELTDWCDELASRRDAFEAWDLNAFWTYVKQICRVSSATERFVNSWLSLRPWDSAERAIYLASARALIRDRERQLKRSRARLGNARALELWGGESGTARLQYRWPPAQRLLRDILEGLRGDNARA